MQIERLIINKLNSENKMTKEGLYAAVEHGGKPVAKKKIKNAIRHLVALQAIEEGDYIKALIKEEELIERGKAEFLDLKKKAPGYFFFS